RLPPSTACFRDFPNAQDVSLHSRRDSGGCKIHGLPIKRKARRENEIPSGEWQDFRSRPFTVAPARDTKKRESRERGRRVQLREKEILAVRAETATRFGARSENDALREQVRPVAARGKQLIGKSIRSRRTDGGSRD